LHHGAEDAAGKIEIERIEEHARRDQRQDTPMKR
jgi:hypothetical protein